MLFLHGLFIQWNLSLYVMNDCIANRLELWYRKKKRKYVCRDVLQILILWFVILAGNLERGPYFKPGLTLSDMLIYCFMEHQMLTHIHLISMINLISDYYQ